jgi:DNA modification methylase
MPTRLPLFDSPAPEQTHRSDADVISSLAAFCWEGRETAVSEYRGDGAARGLPVLTNEFWTSRQRDANSLHEISYRACFKAQLPEFFITRLTDPGDPVYDPFAGRGTTLLEAALHGRVPLGCDVNPLSYAMLWPRLSPPTAEQVDARLAEIDLRSGDVRADLLTFYHPDTLGELCALRSYLLGRESTKTLDAVDEWIRMVTVNRLTGHSRGFLSVYTLPPNQAVSLEAQRKINARRTQTPPRRELRAIVAQKTRSLLTDVDDATRRRLAAARRRATFHVGSCATRFWRAGAVHLIVTSPPFLDVVDYATDNWLRGWFCGLDVEQLPIETPSRLDDWRDFIARVFAQFARLVRPGGFVAFEVGEVRGGRVRLEDTVIPCGSAAGFEPVCLLINQQAFTKTANIWGVSNNAKGTNTNRIVVFRQGKRGK